MRSAVVAALALAGVGLAEVPALAQRGRGGQQNAIRSGWIFNLSAGQQRARQTGKPIMVVLRCVP